MRNRKLICVEGYSGAGKSKLIEDITKKYSKSRVNVFSKYHPELKNIYTWNDQVDFVHSKWSKLSVRTSRLYMSLLTATQAGKDINIFDRGLLTFYINCKIEQVNDDLIAHYINDFLMRIGFANFEYATALLESSIEVTNSGLRKNRKDYDKRIAENFRFKKYIEEIDSYHFLGKLIRLDGFYGHSTDIQKLEAFIDS